jgi:hypothetical protein
MEKYVDTEVSKIQILIDVVGKETGLDILRTPKKRHRNLTDSRAVFMYLSRKNTLYSLADIGLLFKTASYKGKDHSTVLHQSNKIKNFLDVEEVYVSNLVRRCQESFDKICVEMNIPKTTIKKPKKKILSKIRRYKSHCLHTRINLRGKLNTYHRLFSFYA